MIIIHDFFDQNGGGENLISSISKLFNCRIYSAFNNKKNSNLIIQSKFSFILKKYKIFTFLYFCLFAKYSDSKLIFFSGNHCCYSIKRSKSPYKILYAHSLPKTLFDGLYFDHEGINLNSILKKFIIKLYYKNLLSLNEIIFNSKKTKNKFFHVFPNLNDKIKFSVLYPFSEMSFKINSKKNNFTKKYFVINSRHQTYKNIKNILLMMEEFLNSNPDYFVYVTHEGNTTENLKDSFHNKNIKFTGYLSFKSYQKILINSSAIIFPSRDEDFGISALDAYNLDVPVLVQKNCGFSEILNSNYNFFYDDLNFHKVLTKAAQERFLNKTIYNKKKDFKKIFKNYLTNNIIKS